MKFACTSLLVLSLLLPHAGFAQDNTSSEDDLVKSTQSDLMMVAGGGIAGAVLGLSTLSFYDKPSTHVANIWTGAAIGIIAGVVVVAMSHAERSQEDLTSYSPKTTPEFSTAAREHWHFDHIARFSPDSSSWGTSLWGATF